MIDEPKPQADKFRELARQLEADEDPSHFEEVVKRIAPKGPAPGACSQPQKAPRRE
jgi:hypothetical protein